MPAERGLEVLEDDEERGVARGGQDRLDDRGLSGRRDGQYVLDVLAGEQSCGTFTRLPGETDELRQASGAAPTRLVIIVGPSSSVT